jgi:hypothetical protein
MEVRGVPRDCTAAAVSTRGGAVRHVPVSCASCARCSTKRRRTQSWARCCCST